MSESWGEIIFSIASEDLDAAVEALCAAACEQLYIEDYSDMERTLPLIGRADYIDDELLEKDTTRAAIHLYVPEDMSAFDEVDRLSGALRDAHVTHSATTRYIAAENWEDGWKKFYHASRVGSGRLVICPSWESFEAARDDAVVRIDPGSSFGSGTHESTRLCLELAEKYVKEGARVLDIGCGSGILSLAALALGASGALAADVESGAVRTSLENAALNGFEARFEARCGDVLADADFADALGGDYDVIFANIVADTLIDMAGFFVDKLKTGGALIASGIISSREGEARAAFEGAGLAELETREDNGWYALAFTRG